METIRVEDIIETAFSMDDAILLSEEIEKRLNNDEGESREIGIDFDGIRYFTTLFFNNAIVKFIGDIGFEKYSKQIKLINLSDVGKNTYQHSLENAKDFYALSESQREELTEMLSELDSED